MSKPTIPQVITLVGGLLAIGGSFIHNRNIVWFGIGLASAVATQMVNARIRKNKTNIT